MSERRCKPQEHDWRDAGANPNTDAARVRCRDCGEMQEVSPAHLMRSLQEYSEVVAELSRDLVAAERRSQ